MSLKKWASSIFNPPYQLTLSEKMVSELSNETIYIFKQYGSHDYIKITYNDIVGSSSIMQAINPKNLMDIHLNEYILKKELDSYRIKEVLRNNLYKISNNATEEIYSGEHICKNIDMFDNISVSDIFKIAYTSGFNKGRRISIEINELVNESKEEIKEINSENVTYLDNKYIR
ncbi:hypothetical protein [Glaciimonas immobilis]|uniref:Uncharacterized protein n=1 Tax=Glaciimonas immobilis TaxID=728004 RepID=A0A840RNN2_9BURK|nr:hypothetical protein [Glaciimonas immobilis]KAF3997105.1 hypothetical protein HAV38_15695 [Glaciimonas immobilis]MBB5199967.1 hypothetical protein [Glaciimonas immobilis]